MLFKLFLVNSPFGNWCWLQSVCPLGPTFVGVNRHHMLLWCAERRDKGLASSDLQFPARLPYLAMVHLVPSVSLVQLLYPKYCSHQELLHSFSKDHRRDKSIYLRKPGGKRPWERMRAALQSDPRRTRVLHPRWIPMLSCKGTFHTSCYWGSAVSFLQWELAPSSTTHPNLRDELLQGAPRRKKESPGCQDGWNKSHFEEQFSHSCSHLTRHSVTLLHWKHSKSPSQKEQQIRPLRKKIKWTIGC